MKLSDITSGTLGKGERASFPVRLINYKQLKPSSENRYSMGEIEELANMIELAGGVKQNLLAKKIAPEEYELIAGHRRRAAVEYLVEKKGLKQYELMPVHIESAGNAADRLMLYLDNAGQRKKSDYDRMIELEGVTGALWELQAGSEEERKKFCEFCEVEVPEEISGRKFREVVAKKLGLSVTKYANLAHISRNLSDELKSRFEEGEIGISAANVAAALSPERQKKLAEKGNISLEDAKQEKEQENEERRKQDRGQRTEVERTCDDRKPEKETEKESDRVVIEGHNCQTPAAGEMEPQQLKRGITHCIRIGETEYQDIVSGGKRYKLLKNDQKFKTNDDIEMMKFSEGRNTGKSILAKISYLEEGANGLTEGYCIIGLQILRAGE